MSDDDIDLIIPRVIRCVAEVLALEPDEIGPDSKLIDELGAESLDLVELMFLLEQEFRIRLSRDDVSLTAQLGIPEAEIHQDEILTPRALELLRARFPQSRELLQGGIARKHLASLMTVREVALSVERKLEADARIPIART